MIEHCSAPSIDVAAFTIACTASGRGAAEAAMSLTVSAASSPERHLAGDLGSFVRERPNTAMYLCNRPFEDWD
jgi:hypothetical protein